MKRILLTGGGSGGHVYPLLAVADALQKISEEVVLFYLGPKSIYDEEFKMRGISFLEIVSSKFRRYLSPMNLIDIPKFFIGLIQALAKLFKIMPDVVFSKGGTGALPVVLAAKFYMIPVIIHESDSVPGLTNRISGKLADKIGISFSDAAKYFSKGKIALTGNPIRKSFLSEEISHEHAREALGFDFEKPLVLVLGGSQGAVQLNSLIFDNFSLFLKNFYLLHQVGEGNASSAQNISIQIGKETGIDVSRGYRYIPFLGTDEMRNALLAADVVISRAGSGAIFEIAAFGKPSILIPLETSAGDHQRANAYSYAETGAAVVIEKENLKAHIVLHELGLIASDEKKRKLMIEAAKIFSKPDAADIIAREIITLAVRN